MKYKLLKDITGLGETGDIIKMAQQHGQAVIAGHERNTTMSVLMFDILVHTGMIEKCKEPVFYTLKNPPTKGTVYYRVYFDGVDPWKWTDCPYDWHNLATGNCHATYEQAERKHAQVKKTIAENTQ